MLYRTAQKKGCRTGKYEQVEEAVLKWFYTMREKNENISQEMMMLKSEELANKLGHHEFKATRDG